MLLTHRRIGRDFGRTLGKNTLQRIVPPNVRPFISTLLMWGIVGYFIRILIMPVFASEDLLTNSWIGLTLIKTQHIVLSSEPPLYYYLLAPIYALFNPVLPQQAISGITNTAYYPTFLSSLFRVSYPNSINLIFVTKIPNLIFDLALALLLLHMIDDGKKATFAFKLWMVNPITIYVSYVVGQNDIIATFFLMLALYFFKNKKIGWTAVSLGISGVFKIVGLLFIIPIGLIHIKEHRTLRLKLTRLSFILVASLIPLVVVQIATFFTPAYYESANMALSNSWDINGFFGNTFFSRGQQIQPFLGGLFLFALDYSTKAVTWFGGTDVIYLLPLVYSLFLFGVFYWKSWSFERVWKAFLVFFLAYYAFDFFHVQWFLWTMPLLTMLVAEDRDRFFKIFLLTIPLYFIYTLHWDFSLTSQLLLPMIHQAYFWPGPIQLLNNIGLPAYQVINIFRSIFSAVCIVFIALVLGIDHKLGHANS